MICDPCKSAGEYLSSGDIACAIEAHRNCANPTTCPCHHRTDANIINQERIQQDDAATTNQ